MSRGDFPGTDGEQVVTCPGVGMMAVMPTAKTKIVELAMADFHLLFFACCFHFSFSPRVRSIDALSLGFFK